MRKATYNSRIRKYLDLAAEDSDDPDGDDEDEDEETMSDREFLADDDTGENKIVSHPQHTDDEEDDDVHALATHYELAVLKYDREAAREATASSVVEWPVEPRRGDGRRFLADADAVPGTWVRPITGVHRGQLAFVLSTTTLYFAPTTHLSLPPPSTSMTRLYPPPIPPPLPTLTSNNLKKHNTLQEWTEVDTGIAMKQKMFPTCTPTADELAPFADSPHPDLDGQRLPQLLPKVIAWAKVAPSYDGTASFEKDARGIYLKVQHLMRHGLDAPVELRIHDRVRVVDGSLYLGVCGRVLDIAAGVVTILVNADVNVVGPSKMSANRQKCQIQVACVTRYIKLGDLVRVLRGEHKGQVGFVVALRTGGSIPQAHRPDGFNPTMELTTSPGFIVRPADVDFEHDVSGMTIETKARLPVQAGLGPNAPANNKNPFEMYNDALQPWMGVDTRESAESVLERRYMRRGQTYEGITVQVGGKHNLKGFRGMVVGHHESPERVKKLAQQRSTGTDDWDNQDGVVITIRHELSNHTRASMPPPPPSADSAADLAWGVPANLPELDGESTSDWMNIPGLVMKRVDVKIVGVKNLLRPSANMSGLEGKMGYLLQGAPITAADAKVMVYGAGKNGTKHQINRTCIKPRRENDAGRKLIEVVEHVVIIGPNQDGSMEHKGEYGQTQPHLAHLGPANVVGVVLAVTRRPAFFPISSLCWAKNITLPSPHGNTLATNFD
ncbi:hypothetical protein B0H19DRAFT_1271585 [Mycena capillaripes]|nr:hypothetical protein B0H19DRAFT_1271585 [Mycena capillaripes]